MIESVRRVVVAFGIVLACFSSSFGATSLSAQANGALFLLVPFGARAVGQGDAVVADTSLGTEGLWWNAASMARLTKQELAIHYSQTAFATSYMLTYARPSRVLGTIAGSFYDVNYGDQPVTQGNGDVSVGNSTNHNYMLALAYASPVGSRLSAGITYKFVMLRLQCTGICGAFPVLSGNTQALDAGVQYRVPGPLPFVLGASIRNLGPALQLKDKDQADPLPKVVQIGAKLRLPIKDFADAGASLDVSADVIQSSALGGPAGGVGAVLGYRDVIFLRGGYKIQPGDGGGPSIGFTLERGGFALDFARRLDALSSQLGSSPTYISLKTRF